MLTEDIYLKFLNPTATPKQQKRMTRMLEAVTLILSVYHPDRWVDVSDAFDTWVHACEAHQLLRGEVSCKYLQYCKGLAAKRRAEVGVEYAVTTSLPPISRKRKIDFFPIDSESVMIF